jgi:hypothetical protein
MLTTTCTILRNQHRAGQWRHKRSRAGTAVGQITSVGFVAHAARVTITCIIIMGLSCSLPGCGQAATGPTTLPSGRIVALTIVDHAGRIVHGAWGAYWRGRAGALRGEAGEVWAKAVTDGIGFTHSAASETDLSELPGTMVGIGANGYGCRLIPIPMRMPGIEYSLVVTLYEARSALRGIAQNEKGEPVAGTAILIDASGSPPCDLLTPAREMAASLASYPQDRHVPPVINITRPADALLPSVATDNGEWWLSNIPASFYGGVLFVPSDKTAYAPAITPLAIVSDMPSTPIVIRIGQAARLRIRLAGAESGETRPTDGEFTVEGTGREEMRLWGAFKASFGYPVQVDGLIEGTAVVEVRRGDNTNSREVKLVAGKTSDIELQ